MYLLLQLMTDIQWSKPPPGAAKPYKSTKWTRVVDELRKRPGRWAHVQIDGPAGTAHVIAHRLRSVGCETYATTDTASNIGNVWARWPKSAT